MSEYCKVLIVDDEFIMRQGMKHMLEWEKEGFQIVGEASNGQEGLDLVAKLEPHIVLADIVMPIIDGIEFSEILSAKYPAVQLIILSSYDKFEYVKTTLLNGATDYILKPTLNPEILLKTLKKAASGIAGLQLHTQDELPYASQVERVLLGYKDKLDEFTFVDVFPNTLYRLFAIDLRELCGQHKEERIHVCRVVEEFFEEQGGYVTLPVLIEESILCVVINYRIKDEAAVLEDANAIADRIQRLYERAFFVLSRNYLNMHEMRKYYQQDILSEIHNAFYYVDKHLLIAERYREKEEIERFAFELYTRHLSGSRYEEALRMFAEYIDYLCEKQMPEERLKNLAKNLLYHYLMEIEKYDVDGEALKERYFAFIDTAVHVERFRMHMETILEEIKELLRKKAGSEDLRIAQIKQYVAKHYEEPLELYDIAQQFNFNYNYLSSYFNQTTKEGFSEYLNKVRIEHACDLLRAGDMAIAEIGNAVGYSEHSYFCRVFKKIIGETPSAYRRRMKL